MKLAKANGGSMNHVYCSVRCGRCKTILVLKYLGVHDGREEYDIPDSCPVFFKMRCSNVECREIIQYTRNDVEVIAFPESPPSDFVEQF